MKKTQKIDSAPGKKGILIAFGEFFLKSRGVRDFFKEKLVQNISFFLKKEEVCFKLHIFHNRIFVETSETKKAANLLKMIFGISWVAECSYFPKTNLKEFSGFIGKNYKDWIKEKETFALKLRIEEGALKDKKEKVIERVAENIERKVDLSKPKREIFIEIRKNGWFLYLKKTRGAGGLPLGSSGKVLTLMSGGIDSPVAGYLALKRGAENIWLHFHSFPLVSNKSIEKVKELAKMFIKYQPRLKVYFVPFHKIQAEIKTKTNSQYRILLYRRIMLKIAEIISEKENCEALVTGESLGQVSSQTLSNMRVIEEAVKIPVLRPLVSMDKEEIVQLAKRLGTFEVSVKPHEDCCTLFTPKHPTAKGSLKTAKELQNKLNVDKMIKEAIKEVKTNLY
jgi:thiamine biosynthesis protein ThiI